MKRIKNLLFSTSIILTMAIIGSKLTKDENAYNLQIEIDTIDIDKTTSKIDSILLSATPSPSPTLSNENEIIEVNDERKLVSLTFDDGPSKYTEELLEVLDKNNVKATFFVLGCNCDNYPDALSKISSNGHEIAIHGDTHTSFTKLSIEQINEEITNTIDYCETLDINISNLVRPPYGSLNDEVKENVNYPLILWSIDTEDWKTKDKEKIKAEILENIQEGSIVLMHDTKAVHAVDIEVLEDILPDLTKEYNFVTISELVDYSNIQLENGKTYRKIKSEN